MHSDVSRKKLLEEYEDSLMRLVMHELAEHEGELYLKESKALRDSKEAGPSPEALEKFSKRLDAELKKQRAKTRHQLEECLCSDLHSRGVYSKHLVIQQGIQEDNI